MLDFNPHILIPELRNTTQKFDPDIHHVIAILSVLGDSGFKIRGSSDTYIESVNKTGLADLRELTFSHPEFTNVWFIWNIEEGVIELVEGSHPEISDELVDLDVNDFLTFAIDEDIIDVIKEILGDKEVSEDLSWAECVDRLQEYEIYSDDEDLEMMRAFVYAMECKIQNKED